MFYFDLTHLVMHFYSQCIFLLKKLEVNHMLDEKSETKKISGFHKKISFYKSTIDRKETYSKRLSVKYPPISLKQFT